jgi:hypothetical protein
LASFQISDRIITSKKIYAGLGENGQFVCKQGEKGTVVQVEDQEPDGVHARMDTGFKWWFKPNQIKHVEEKNEH